jgi:hypothetical protein
MKKSMIAIGWLAACALAHAQTETPSAATNRPPVVRQDSPTPYSAPIPVPSAAGQIAVPRLAPPHVTINPVPAPAFTSSCDSGGCWGSDGTRYNAVGGALVRPDGKTCQSVAGVMQCP